MEHLIRILNDHDRQVLAWLRTLVGDARLSEAARRLVAPREQHVGVPKPYLSTVCRYLGVRPPAARQAARAATDHSIADRHLARMRQILGQHRPTARQAAR